MGDGGRSNKKAPQGIKKVPQGQELKKLKKFEIKTQGLYIVEGAC
jgi:hypothetical protein